MKLTKRTVDAARPQIKRHIVWDDELKGFGLVVQPSGIKSYVLNYRHHGRDRHLMIGRHGEITCEQARKIAAEHKRTVIHGGDPLGSKQAQREAPTVGDILDAYLASEDFANKTPGTQAIDRGRIERHLRPLLGKRHAHLVTDNDIKRTLAAIRDGRTSADIKTRKRGRARVTGGAGTARMAIDLLRVAFNFAIKERVATANPCAGVKTGSSGTRDTIMGGADDYARLFQTLDRMEGELRIRRTVADAIRVIALTGCWRGEVAGLRWSYVDLKQGRLVLPPAAHKTGKRTGKPRVIGLPSAAQAIIARQPFTATDGFVFAPARGDGGAIELSHAWAKVRTEAKLPATIGLHGLRHSLASHMAMGGAQASEIMTALGHRQLSTAQKYIHWAEDSRQALAEKAATVALAGMAASKPKGEVVLLNKGGRP